MLIIFEGQDRVGKDTQIKLLIKYINNYEYIHFKKPSSKINAIRDIIINIKKIQENPNKIWIWNRSHISDYIYGKIYRKYNSDYIFDVEKKYKKIFENAYLIFLFCDIKTLLEREDGQSPSGKEINKYKELNRYYSAIEKSIIQNKLKIKNINIQETNEKIKLFLKI